MTRPKLDQGIELPRILIVDDFAPAADGMAEALRGKFGRGPNVRAAHSPASALVVAEKLLPLDPAHLPAIVTRCLERHRLVGTNLRLLKHIDAQLERARLLQQRMLPSRSMDAPGGLLARSNAPCV